MRARHLTTLTGGATVAAAIAWAPLAAADPGSAPGVVQHSGIGPRPCARHQGKCRNQRRSSTAGISIIWRVSEAGLI